MNNIRNQETFVHCAFNFLLDWIELGSNFSTSLIRIINKCHVIQKYLPPLNRWEEREEKNAKKRKEKRNKNRMNANSFKKMFFLVKKRKNMQCTKIVWEKELHLIIRQSKSSFQFKKINRVENKLNKIEKYKLFNERYIRFWIAFHFEYFVNCYAISQVLLLLLLLLNGIEMLDVAWINISVWISFAFFAFFLFFCVTEFRSKVI